MSTASRIVESLDAHRPVSYQAPTVANHRARSAGRVVVCVNPERYTPAGLIAGASLAQEIGGLCYMVCVAPRTIRRLTMFHAASGSATTHNLRLAETLGIIVVRVAAEDPSDGVIAFAHREGATHVIVGQGQHSRAALSSTARRLSRGLRGVEIRVMPDVDPPPAMPARRQGVLWAKRHPIVVTELLMVLLAVGAVAIAYTPWPLAVAIVAFLAVTWCVRLESRRDSSRAAAS